MSMYTGAKIVARSVYVTVTVLNVIVMEALSRDFRVAVPWELLYADDLVVIAETEDDPIRKT